jgi:predicted metal-dependent hydrolase
MVAKNILHEAYELLFPESEQRLVFDVVYTGRVRDFGAFINMRGDVITLKISKKFRGVAKEIQIGIAQELLCRLFKKKKKTLFMDLYNNFVRNLHKVVPKDKNDPVLEASFNRVNERYFVGLVERPNLVWGQNSVRTFGSYNFKSDTITMSRIFEKSDTKYLDYVMFHEMLHKQRKFETRGLRTRYHDSKFKRAEKIFKDSEQIEKDLRRFAVKMRVKSFFGF